MGTREVYVSYRKDLRRGPLEKSKKEQTTVGFHDLLKFRSFVAVSCLASNDKGSIYNFKTRSCLQ
jgi:hypothetical protein